jgi:phage-related protein
VATEVFNLKGSIGLDTSAFTQNISKAMNSADNMSKHLDHVGDSIEDAQKAIDKAVDVVNGFGKSVTNLESPFTTLNNKLEVCQSATQAAQEQVDYLTENFNEYAKSAGTASEDTAALYEALQKAEHQLAQCQAAEQAAQEALDAYNTSVNDTVDSAGSASQENDDLAKKTESAGQAADEAGGSFLSFADILKANVISDLITKGIEVAISQIGQLKDSIKGLATGFVDSVSGLAQYGDQIDKQSQKIGISAEKYQEWDAVLQHSGTSIGVLQAGMRTLRNAMDSLGDASGEAVVDQQKLAAAQTAYDNAVLTAEKAAIDYNAAVEKSGEDSDDAISKLIALEKAQNNVESAQSKLNAAMEGSTPKMSDAAAALHSLGISATDSMGNLRDEEEVFSEVITALQNMENETEKQRYATILLGRGGTELGALLNTTAEDTEKMKQRVHELNGVLSDEAVKASARFQDSLQDMTTGFTGLKNSMLQDFLPVFADVMDGVTDIFAGDSEGGKSKIESGLDGITETIEKSLPRVLEIGEQFMSMGDKLAPAIFKTFDMISDSIIKSVENIDVDSAVNTLLDALTGGADVVGRFAGSLTDLFVNSIDSLANSGGIERVISVVSDMMDKGGKKLVEVLPKLSTSVATIIEKIMQSIPETLTGENSANLIDSLVDSVVTIATAVANNIEPVANAITVAIPKLVSALVGNIEPLINAASTIFTSLVDSITQDDGILDNLVSGISTIVDSIVDNIDPILLALENVVNTVIEKLLEPDVISKIGESLANVLGSAIVGAAKVLGSLAGYSVRLGQTLGETLAQVDWQGVIVDGLAGIGAGIIEALGITEEFESGVETIEGYIDEVKEYWESGWESLEDFGAGVFDWFANIGESIINFADSIAQGVENIISGFTDNPILNGIKGFGDKVGNWLGFGDKEKQISNGFSKSSSGASASSGRNVTINYTQNNTSPQALDEYEIWRQNKRAMDDLRANLGGVW